MDRHYHSIFGPYIVQFIEFKNSLGYTYKTAGWALSLFDRLALERDVPEPVVTKELADQFCIIRPNETDKTRHNRISIISQFARFLGNLGLGSYIAKCPQVKNTYTPYIFSKKQVLAIFKVCDELTLSRNRNSSVLAIPMLIRLLYGTGIRISEALSLAYSDVDLQAGYLVLRDTKNDRDRMVPLSSSLAGVCREYIKYRNQFPPMKKSDRFFVKPDGSPMASNSAYKWFRRVLYKAKIPHGGRAHGPRLHDLRHTFSVHALASMSESGMDLYYCLPILSTYLGHQSLRGTDTYVRLTAEMYPGLINKASLICSGVFPAPYTNKENHETH